MKIARFFLSFIIYLIIYSFIGLLIDMVLNNEYNEATYTIRRLIQLVLNIMYVIYVTRANQINMSYKVKPQKLIIYIAVLFSFIFLYEATVDVLIDRLFTPDALSQSRESGIQALFNYPAALFIQACVSAPLLEEVLVRGVLYEILRERLSVAWSVTITSLFFTIMHFDSFNTLFYIMICVIFSYIYIKTKSITYCVILHMCVNTLSFLTYYSDFVPQTPIITVISILVVICTFIYIARPSLRRA